MTTHVDPYRARSPGVRVLFCFGVTQNFFDEEGERLPDVMEAAKAAFRDLEGRFGVTVLGTLDDDELMVGATSSWPWTGYVLAHAPDHGAVAAVCNLLRETAVGDGRLWKYLKVEARVGRPLFFGES